MIKLGQMVLKGVIWVHNRKIRLYGLERSQLRYTMENSGHMVFERRELGTQYKNQVIWS